MQSNEGPDRPGFKSRIESLSNLVFGLALSVGSIILISRSVSTAFDLVSNIALFGFSFAIIIWIWSGYTRIMTLLPSEVRVTLALNIILLFCVAIEPYLFYVLFSVPPDLLDFSSLVYAIDASAMMFILAGLTRILLTYEKRLKTHQLSSIRLTQIGRIMTAEVVAGSIFLFSALPFPWVQDPLSFSYLRFDLWYFTFVTFFIGLVRRRSDTEGERSGNPPS